MNSITEKVVVITGASSGLGEATARLLSERGAKVVLAARRADRLENLAKDIKKAGGEALTVITDVAKRDDMENLIRSAEEKFERVDVLVNNAGVISMAAMSKRKVEEWDLMIDVNIKGVLYGIAAVLPGMLNNRIIKVGTLSTCHLLPGYGYLQALVQFTVQLNLRLRPSARGCELKWVLQE